MTAVDIAGAVGDLLSWIGLIGGLPLLVIALMIRVSEGAYAPVPVTIVDDLDDRGFALWSVGGRTCTRALTTHEQVVHAEKTSVEGYVSTRDPERMRFDRRSPAVRICLLLAIVLLSAAAIGFLVSLLPLVM